MLGMAGLACGQTAEVYPKPVSESVEQTVPPNGLYVPQVLPGCSPPIETSQHDTNESNRPGLGLRGHHRYLSLFCGGRHIPARHEGDVFTYRFDLGDQSRFRILTLDLGHVNFAAYVARRHGSMAECIDGVDLTVRYIKDILRWMSESKER